MHRCSILHKLTREEMLYTEFLQEFGTGSRGKLSLCFASKVRPKTDGQPRQVEAEEENELLCLQMEDCKEASEHPCLSTQVK